MINYCKGCKARIELYNPICIGGNDHGDCPCYRCVVMCMCMVGCPAFTVYLKSIKHVKDKDRRVSHA